MASLSQQWKATKSAWDDDTSNESPGARFGLMFDPLAYIFGDKYRKEITGHGDKANLELSKLLGTDDRGGWAANKPASTLGLMAAAYYGGGALMGGGGAGGAGGGGAGGGGTTMGGLGNPFANGGTGGMAGVGGGNAGALAQSGGIGGGAGMGSATPAAGFDLQSIMGQGGFGSMPGMSTGAPPQQQSAPQFQPKQMGPIPEVTTKGPPSSSYSLANQMRGGLGRMRDALTPVDPRVAEGMDPAHLKQLRNQAMLRMGLGMMANAHQGGRFGEALAAGLGQSQGAFNRDIEGTYQRGVEARKEKRDEARETKRDQRYDSEFTYRQKVDEIDQDFKEKKFDSDERYRRRQMALEEFRMGAGPQAPAGYRYTPSGDLQFIPGGPADPASGKRNASPSEYDRKARLLFGEMRDAEKQYKTEAGKGETSLWDSFLDATPITRVFTSEDYRQREAAGLRWAQNFLYLKSGAAATNEEVRKTFLQYLPQPGDSEAVINQKAEARQQAMQNVANANGIDIPAGGADEGEDLSDLSDEELQRIATGG